MATSSESKASKPWTAVDVKELKLLLKLKRPAKEIGDVLGRSVQAIRAKVASLRSARKAGPAKKTTKKAAKKATKKAASSKKKK